MVLSISFLSGFDAALDGLLVAGAFDDRGVVLVDADLLGPAELADLDVFELDAEFFEDGLAAGDDGDVFEHGLAAIAEAGRLDGGDFEDAAELVDDQCREGFAFDVFGDDEHGLARLGGLAEDRHQVAGGADLLLVNQDIRVFQHRPPASCGSVTKCGRDIPCRTACLRPDRRGFEALALFDGDHAVFADLVHGVGDHLADLLILVGARGADLGDFLGVLDLLGHLGELFDDRIDGEVNPLLDLRGIGAGGDVPQAFGEDRFGIDGGGGGAIAGDAGGLAGDFLDHLRPCFRRNLRARFPWRRLRRLW